MVPGSWAFKAKILVLGFIRAESAVIGLLKGCNGILISIITTLFCGAVSRTHIYLSDSMVTFVKVINCGLIPMLVNVRDSFMVIGALAAAMVAKSKLRDQNSGSGKKVNKSQPEESKER